MTCDHIQREPDNFNLSHFPDMDTNFSTDVNGLSDNVTAEFQEREFQQFQTTHEVYLSRIITPIVLAIGVAANIANLCILGRKSFRRGLNHIERSALTGLLTLSVSDTLFCVVGLPAAFLPIGPYAESHDYLQLAGLFYGIYRRPLINIFLFTSTWLIVWISMERYMAVCHPFQARTAIRTRRSTVIHIIIFILAVAINVPLFYASDVTKSDCYSIAPSTINPIFWSIHNVIWAVFGTFLPFILLSFCNIKILCAVRDAEALSTSDGHNRILSRVTTTLIVMVFLYLILVTPSMILTFLSDYVKTMSDSQFVMFRFAIHITNFCQAVKFSSNFMLYCITNKQFRDNVTVKQCKTTSSRLLTPDGSTAKRYQVVGTPVGHHLTSSKQTSSTPLKDQEITNYNHL